MWNKLNNADHSHMINISKDVWICIHLHVCIYFVHVGGDIVHNFLKVPSTSVTSHITSTMTDKWNLDLLNRSKMHASQPASQPTQPLHLLTNHQKRAKIQVVSKPIFFQLPSFSCITLRLHLTLQLINFN